MNLNTLKPVGKILVSRSDISSLISVYNFNHFIGSICILNFLISCDFYILLPMINNAFLMYQRRCVIQRNLEKA